ncbi:TPA: hypothetical protein DE059_03795 [Candidatus Peribacteria bacterium]|nr:hypothetical protein [Candidatus Peribacteria bacterium]|tara:strand:+ start:1253 stop:1588 length:336 start_codon:yes stop_codon:yes gene_type:complete
MSTGTLSNDLKSNGVPHFVSQEPDQLYVDEFHGATPIDDPKVVDMLSFFMNTDVSRFPRSSIEEMVAEVQVHSKRRESGRFEFDHPQGFLVVPNEQSTTDFCQIGGFQRIE